ncbi:MAG: azurin [Gammaproteobacteria bacterium]|jgi:azurin|nr:azurin [Gammaproteobacteria bacterium]
MMKKMSLTAVALVFSGAAMAQCSFEIEATDQMTWNTPEIKVPGDCTEVTVTLKHVGKLPKQTMGHGWVLTKGADMQGVASAGMAAGIANNHIPQGDGRVIAHTNLVGGGETDSVTFSTSGLEKGGDYSYFCPFPGHFAVMKGKLTFG